MTDEVSSQHNNGGGEHPEDSKRGQRAKRQEQALYRPGMFRHKQQTGDTVVRSRANTAHESSPTMESYDANTTAQKQTNSKAQPPPDNAGGKQQQQFDRRDNQQGRWSMRSVGGGGHRKAEYNSRPAAGANDKSGPPVKQNSVEKPPNDLDKQSSKAHNENFRRNDKKRASEGAGRHRNYQNNDADNRAPELPELSAATDKPPSGQKQQGKAKRLSTQRRGQQTYNSQNDVHAQSKNKSDWPLSTNGKGGFDSADRFELTKSQSSTSAVDSPAARSQAAQADASSRGGRRNNNSSRRNRNQKYYDDENDDARSTASEFTAYSGGGRRRRGRGAVASAGYNDQQQQPLSQAYRPRRDSTSSNVSNYSTSSRRSQRQRRQNAPAVDPFAFNYNAGTWHGANSRRPAPWQQQQPQQQYHHQQPRQQQQQNLYFERSNDVRLSTGGGVGQRGGGSRRGGRSDNTAAHPLPPRLQRQQRGPPQPPQEQEYSVNYDDVVPSSSVAAGRRKSSPVNVQPEAAHTTYSHHTLPLPPQTAVGPSSFDSLISNEPVGELDWSLEVEMSSALSRDGVDDEQQADESVTPTPASSSRALRAQHSQGRARGVLSNVAHRPPPAPLNETQSPVCSSAVDVVTPVARGGGRGAMRARVVSNTAWSPTQYNSANAPVQTVVAASSVVPPPPQPSLPVPVVQQPPPPLPTTPTTSAFMSTEAELAHIDAQAAQLKQYLQTNARCLDEEVLCRKLAELSAAYRRILPANLKYTFQHNVEQQLWLNTFYLVLEDLRESEEKLKANFNLITKVIEQGIAFYVALMNEMAAAANVDYEGLLLLNSSLSSGSLCGACLRQPADVPNSAAKLTVFSIARFMLALGDLNRYKAMLHRTEEYNKARSYYLKAVQLTAANGRAYNQLAILAMYTQRVVETMYFYMRALSTKHKFEATKPTLDALINEFRKRVEKLEKSIEGQVEEIMRENGAVENMETDAAADCAYVEIWKGNVWATGQQRSRADVLRTILIEAPTKELYKHSVWYVLNVCGMLYNKIGMEAFECQTGRALSQLWALLQRPDTPLSDVQLLQLCTVCMHTVHHTAPAPMYADSGTSPEQHVCAARFALSVWTVLLRAALAHTESLDQLQQALEGNLLAGQACDDLRQLQMVLPALSLMCRWLSTPTVFKMYSCMRARVEPCQADGLDLDTWSSFSQLWNRLMRLNKQIVPELAKAVPEAQPVTMPEDMLTLSFNGCFETSKPTVYMLNTYASHPDAQLLYALHRRLQCVCTCGDFLMGMGGEFVCYAEDDVTMRPVVQQQQAEQPAKRQVQPSHSNASSDDTPANANGSLSVEEMSAEMQQLRSGEQANAVKEHMLRREQDAAPVRWVVEPRYIVPDTNVLIDHLEIVQRIAECPAGYNVALPCVVVNELKGLMSGGRPAPSPDNNWLRSRAQTALASLELLMARSNVFAVTTKGNKLMDLHYTEAEQAEALGTKAINDDRILQCCRSYVDDRPPVHNLRDGIELPRRVVLLTSDRALRIKAIGATVPCRSATQFAQWARL